MATKFLRHEDELYHYGVKGMKWGKHKAQDDTYLKRGRVLRGGQSVRARYGDNDYGESMTKQRSQAETYGQRRNEYYSRQARKNAERRAEDAYLAAKNQAARNKSGYEAALAEQQKQTARKKAEAQKNAAYGQGKREGESQRDYRMRQLAEANERAAAARRQKVREANARGEARLQSTRERHAMNDVVAQQDKARTHRGQLSENASRNANIQRNAERMGREAALREQERQTARNKVNKRVSDQRQRSSAGYEAALQEQRKQASRRRRGGR